jgi:GH15 family glucan-1,4-alpha-glucosidase
LTQPPIADYALLGDGRTAALASVEGSIDWMCVPRFDSEPVFGRLVAGDAGGSFSIRPVDGRPLDRRYRDGSTVLETRWKTDSSEVRLVEGMIGDVAGRLLPRTILVRRVTVEGTPTDIRIRFDPRKGLPGTPPRSDQRWGTLMCRWGALVVGLRAEPGLRIVPGEESVIEVGPGSPMTFVLTVADREPLSLVGPTYAARLLEETDHWWRGWSSSLEYDGLLRPAVVRSAITLRLLTYSPSGAPVAAPTTSLPESIGAGRNWDYRFSWPRDASIGVDAFLPLGQTEEARSYFYWLLHATRLTRPRLRVLYTVEGKPGGKEDEVDGVGGYRGSTPVRIGNGAGEQHQLDVYGWVLHAAWLRDRAGQRLPGEEWRAMADVADFVAKRWRDPDAGMWESREEPAQFVHSKLMAWVALDRAVRMARSRRVRRRRLARWGAARDAVAEEVRARGFDERRGTYVRAYGSSDLDGSLLLLPQLEFEEPGSPRISGTVEAVRGELSAGGPLVYRYPPDTDGLPGREGAFLACSSWMVQALALTGRAEEAAELLEDLWARANDVGLFAEQIDPATGEHLGNFPQALTHATLIQAVLAVQPAVRKAPKSAP